MRSARLRVTARRTLRRLAAAVACAALLVGAAAYAADDAAVAKARDAFVDRMVAKHGFDRTDLASLLAGAQIQQKILDTMARPPERVLPWYEYRNIFLNDQRIDAGVQFWKDHAEAIEQMSQRYGVAPEMLVAIIGVETYFGRRMGTYRVLDALATLAFAYPPRASFFASELEAFLLLSREDGVDATAALGSYAGAMGAGQFIPSSYRNYAVDADADGRRDLLGDWDDVLGSVANYFKVSGWQTGQPVVTRATRSKPASGPDPSDKLDLDQTVASLGKLGYEFSTDLPASEPAGVMALEAEGGGSEYWIGFHNFRVITRYNRSPKYALAAHQLGQAIRARYLGADARSAAE